MADAKAQKRAKFDAVFPVLREELLAYLKQEGMPADAIEWYQRVSPRSLAFSLPSLCRIRPFYLSFPT